jgi:SAM-dependent methyltransferase
MDNYRPNTYGDSMADIYDQIQGERDAQAAVEFLAAIARHGSVLELGIGTGRVALPLSAQGIRVQGIDASSAMIEHLRAKPGGDKIPVVLGDFSDIPFDECFKLIFVVFGTFFCLTSQESQVHCFRKVAQHLTDDGVFVLEASVPDFSAFTRGQNVRVSTIDLDRVIVTVTQHDPVSQMTATQHVVATQSGIRLMPVYVRYAWPSELDLMAQMAGLELKERWGDWHHNAFTAASTRHISVYGKRTDD